MPIDKFLRKFKGALIVILSGLLGLGLLECRGEKKKASPNQGTKVVGPEVPEDWSGSNDWDGSPWILEDE